MQQKIIERKDSDKILISQEDIKMTICDSAVDLLIDRLIDMYTDKIGSTVREVVSNAIDASTGNPIYIYYPSEDNLEFIVQDYGCGMSYDDLLKVYTQYGASTKQKDNSKIGAYGLGAKAPFCYTNTFSIETVKDGEKIIGLLSRENSHTQFSILLREKTKDKNGTKVVIPIKRDDIYTFKCKIDIYKKFTWSVPIELKFIEAGLSLFPIGISL